MLSDQTLHYAEALTATLLGVDALCHAELRAADLDAVAAGHAIEAGSESLVVLNMARGQRPESFDSYTDARQRLGELAAEAATLPEADRRLYYDQLCRATHAFTLWREGQLPFRKQIADFLTVPPEPVCQSPRSTPSVPTSAANQAISASAAIWRRSAQPGRNVIVSRARR